MEFVRKAFHALIVGLLSLTLWVGIVAVTMSLVLTNRETVKNWPLEAGIYPKITSQLLEATSGANRDSGNNQDTDNLTSALDDSPLDRQRLEQALGTVYTPDYWQSKFEPVTDSLYDWLDGTKPELEFEVAFNDKNAELASALENELTRQLSEYPPCPNTSNFEDFDPLSASCLPPGVTAKKAASEFAADIRKGDFLADAKISSLSIDLDQDFKQNAPRSYSALTKLPLIMLLVVSILALLSIFSAKSRLRGVKKTGQLLFGIGLVSWLSFFIGNRIGAGFEFRPDGGKTEEQIFAELGQPLIKTAFDDVTSTGLWVALSVVLAGALMWLAAFIWHKVHHSKEAEAIAKRAMSSAPPKADPKLPKPVEPISK